LTTRLTDSSNELGAPPSFKLVLDIFIMFVSLWELQWFLFGTGKNRRLSPSGRLLGPAPTWQWLVLVLPLLCVLRWALNISLNDSFSYHLSFSRWVTAPPYLLSDVIQFPISLSLIIIFIQLSIPYPSFLQLVCGYFTYISNSKTTTTHPKQPRSISSSFPSPKNQPNNANPEYKPQTI
jgi:hypothetical protein